MALKLFEFQEQFMIVLEIQRASKPCIVFLYCWKQGPLRSTKIFGNLQVGCGTKRGAEIAAHSFRNLTERDDNPKRTFLLKIDFKNVFNSLNREIMLNHVFSNGPELYKYTHCAYSKPSYLFFTKDLSYCQKTELSKSILKPHPFLRKHFRY